MIESSNEPDRLPNAPHPRETLALIGHQRQEDALLTALRSGRMHHAWLLGGPEGVGKASFAYRAARFMLAEGDPLRRAEAARDLAMPETDGATRKIAAQSHPDLHLLRRIAKPDGKSFTSNIPVDLVRRIIDRFGSSAGEGGWRVAIVDSAEDLDRPGANALLKLLESPMRRAACCRRSARVAGCSPSSHSAKAMSRRPARSRWSACACLMTPRRSGVPQPCQKARSSGR
jgi:DNA polymerase-3 subunit delta'